MAAGERFRALPAGRRVLIGGAVVLAPVALTLVAALVLVAIVMSRWDEPGPSKGAAAVAATQARVDAISRDVPLEVTEVREEHFGAGDWEEWEVRLRSDPSRSTTLTVTVADDVGVRSAVEQARERLGAPPPPPPPPPPGAATTRDPATGTRSGRGPARAQPSAR